MTNLSGPLLDEGLLNVLRAGGCQCDPPGSAEEFCTGHCTLRAEIERLRLLGEYGLQAASELGRLRAENERLRATMGTAQSLLARNQPQSVADCDGDAWDALAVLKAALDRGDQ